jgi:CLIP-associating protein 1/2
LRRVQQVINSNAVGFENFLLSFTKLVPALGTQLTDLRSAVVKEAAVTVTAAASATQEAFEGCAERLSEVLFKCLNSGTRLIVETGHECMLGLLQHCQTWKLLPKFADQIRSKNPNIRAKASEYVCFALSNYPQAVFERGEAVKAGFLDSLESFLGTALADASAEARAAARDSFRSYHGLYPDRADTLYYRLDPTNQKALGEIRRPLTEIKKPQKKPVKPKPSPASAGMKRAPEDIKSTPAVLSDTGGGEYGKRPQRKSDPVEPPTPETAVEVKQERFSLDAVRRPRPRQDKPKDQIEAFVEKTYDEAWTVRINAFDKLAALWSENPKAQEALVDSQLWDAVLNCLFEHFTDPHMKVQLACLRSLKSLIEAMPEQFSFVLERLLPELLRSLGDPREVIASEAQGVLEAILDLYMPEDLLTLMVKSNLEGTAKVKQRHLELICELSNQPGEFFDTGVNSKAFIKKIVASIKDCASSKPLLLIAFSALQPLSAMNSDLVTSYLLELPGEDLQIVRRAAQETRDPLEAELSQILASRQPPPPPKRQVPPPASVTPPASIGIFTQLSAGGATKMDALKQLEGLSANVRGNSAYWSSSLKEVVEGLLLALKDDAFVVRDLAFKIVRNLAHDCSDLSPYGAGLMNSVIQTFYSEDRQTIGGAEETLESLLGMKAPREILGYLLSLVDKEEVPALQAILRLTVKTVRELDVDLLLSQMDHLMTRLKQQINHVNADVRKSVVFVLVELHFVLAHEFSRYLEDLSPSQQKLVAIYVERRLNSKLA